MKRVLLAAALIAAIAGTALWRSRRGAEVWYAAPSSRPEIS
ncbi:hypothetical protein C731_0043 [Mycolicibacterium hassiacum DSM 44199]|jgi:hypothetical protein|uniref:Uncharacterized protein n=1 Tax=Mycolicibacterium hassiacum (strain DSM 44199 / CIP 105218 / JCM 12690 / 3849) TaxID=1122247 RepID=K5BL35_MYCHD|nr:hypothetical protein [Mycolicibacterium hassiacum]EKF25924.1 hypothetical protein C731_0043 [Mycolicibacterium hassiacum DSM 44199]VCT92487.1 hypothetical protein MHAS_04216 [Mycolicibacterium hassiacum DSM 44199]